MTNTTNNIATTTTINNVISTENNLTLYNKRCVGEITLEEITFSGDKYIVRFTGEYQFIFNAITTDTREVTRKHEAKTFEQAKRVLARLLADWALCRYKVLEEQSMLLFKERYPEDLHWDEYGGMTEPTGEERPYITEWDEDDMPF